MTKKKKKLTKNQQLFRKEQQRIRRFIKNATEKGYDIRFEVPTMPARVTKKAISEIKAIKPVNIYAKSYFVDPDTGELIPARQYQSLKRRLAQDSGKRLYLDEVTISNFKSMLNEYPIGRGAVVVKNWLSKMINDYGVSKVGNMLRAAYADGKIFNYQIAYDESLATDYVYDMIDYIKNDLSEEDFNNISEWISEMSESEVSEYEL